MDLAAVVKSAKMFATVFPRGCVEWDMKNRNFRRISRFILETIQDTAIVTTEDE